MKIKEIKIINQDESTEVADIGADAVNVDYNDTTVKAELDKLNTSNSSLINTQTSQGTKLVNLQSQVSGLASGSPLVANSITEMTDTTRVYVNTTNGDWYYYNGSSWVSGGQYQSTFIGFSQIQNYMLKPKDVYAENLKFMRSILPFSKQVVNAKLGGYNKSTFLPDFDYNSNDFITFIFNQIDLQNLGEIRFSYDSNIIYQSYVLFTENQKARNVESTWINDKNNKISYNSGFDKIAICLPKNNVYIYNQADYYYNPDNLQETLSNNISIKNSNINDPINSNNLNLKRIDLTKVNGVTILPNNVTSGYKTDFTDIDYGSKNNFSVIRIDSRIFTQFKTLSNIYVYIKDLTENDLINFFVGVQLNKFGYNRTITDAKSSEYYDNTTGLLNLRKWLTSNFVTNYQIFGFTLKTNNLLFYTEDDSSLNTSVNTINEIINNKGIEPLYNTVNIFNSIGAIGDSYTAGSVQHSDGSWSNVTNQSYIAVLGKRNGVSYSNFGVGGASTRSYLTNGLQRVLSDAPKDFYMLAFGINDMSIGTDYIGTISDIKEDYTQNADTFYGNYGKIISQVLEHSPKSKLILVKLQITGPNVDLFNTAIENIANHFEIPFINPFDDPFFTSNEYNIRPGGHPTILGYVGMGLAYERLINKCILNNLNYFQYSTIG